MRTTVCSGYDAPAMFKAVDAEVARGLRPTLALVFSSVAHGPGTLADGFAARGIQVLGATTAGEIVNTDMLEESCAVMLIDLDPGAFEVWFRPLEPGQAMSEVAASLARHVEGRFRNPAVLAFASGVRSDGEEVVRGLRGGTARLFPLFGGMAGDDLLMRNTYVFSRDGVSAEGLVALILDGDRVQVEGIATSGWQPVGVEKTVTRAKANVVYTIDDRPALEVYRKYLDVAEPDGVPGEQGDLVVVALGVQYPLRVKRQNGTAVIRAPLFYHPDDQSLIFSGSVPEGSKVTFCIPPALDIVERVVDEAREVRASMPQADAVILVSCKARHLALGPLAEDEIRGIHDLWHAPMVGYFSYGEIGGRRPADCDFHTETCTLVALREIDA